LSIIPFPFRIHGKVQLCLSVAGQAHRLSTITAAKLLSELFRWLRFALGLFAGWQTPFALFAKRQRK
jgi:hypothetical protein